MDISKYFKKKYNFGNIISSFIVDLYNANNYKNILFIRTCTTGGWLDDLLLENDKINRILYYTDKTEKNIKSHESTTIINSEDLEKTIASLNKTFDLICIDTWHEYDKSLHDFTIITPFLNETGMLISHDCYPWNEKVANPHFIPDAWCGETYISFVEFAYNNPSMFYTILNIDTGIGIISKKELNILSNTLDRNKQEQLIYLFKNSKNYYLYFIENSKDIINAIYYK
jgi:hypothetical protein